MQTHYFEVRAISQIEMTEVQVMNHLMQSVHQALIPHNGDIGISFPGYTQKQRKSLGGIIRFLGTEEQLSFLRDDLLIHPAMRDYGLMLPIGSIPKNVSQYVCFSRVRQKGPSALRRAEKRLRAQKKWSEEIKEKMIDKWGLELKYPHCHLKSSSTGQSFILWVKKTNQNEPAIGKFDSYGLSSKTTVPNF